MRAKIPYGSRAVALRDILRAMRPGESRNVRHLYPPSDPRTAHKRLSNDLWRWRHKLLGSYHTSRVGGLIVTRAA